MGESDRTMTHDRARQLIYAERVEGLAAADGQWLQQHLADCADCRSMAAGLESALSGMRAASVGATAAVVARTQALVAARAMELRHQRRAMSPLRVAAAVAATISVVSTPLVWQLFAWVGQMFSASGIASAIVFLLFWVTPALASAVLLIAFGSHRGLWTSAGAGN